MGKDDKMAATYFLSINSGQSAAKLLYAISNSLNEGYWLLIDISLYCDAPDESLEIFEIKEKITIANNQAFLLTNKEFCLLNEKHWLDFDWSELYFFYQHPLETSALTIRSCDYYALSIDGNTTWVMASSNKIIEQQFIRHSLKNKPIDLGSYQFVKPLFTITDS